MATNQEKIKAFLNDEEFIEKVSGGTATAETYREELKKIDVNLSTQEAAEVKKVTDQILHTPEAELTDALLEKVVGGASAVTAGFGAATATLFIGSIGCDIAGLVIKQKLNNAIKKENLADIKKYNSLATHLELASYSGKAGAIISAFATAATALSSTSNSSTDHVSPPNQILPPNRRK